jgi:hypothetical protein
LKKKALNHPLCRTVSERVYRPAVRQDMKWMNRSVWLDGFVNSFNLIWIPIGDSQIRQ